MNQEPPLSQVATLRRRNSIAMSVVIPTKLSLLSSTFPPSHLKGAIPSPLDISLLSQKSSSSYTSLKDLLLPSATVNSPTASNSTTTSAYEISIRNRLVKHAAWAYLQPMSSSPDSSGTHFLRRLWLGFSIKNPITACFRFLSGHVIPSITSAFDRILHAIRVPT
ncbi:early nodulin [Salix suchowensis]|nr:early nodulin [Salix suchowensis]KAG5243924.1 early nodulin [Salix suchowensis]